MTLEMIPWFSLDGYAIKLSLSSFLSKEVKLGGGGECWDKDKYTTFARIPRDEPQGMRLLMN